MSLSPRKLIIDLDPGIGDAMAAVLAMLDRHLDLLALTATPGCVSAPVATRNVQALVEQVDPPKWPRLGAACTVRGLGGNVPPIMPASFAELTGPTGLGDSEFAVAELHHRHDSSKVMTDLVKMYPHEITLLTLGPLDNVAAACERSPDFLTQLHQFICLGGSIAEGGDVTAAAEFNIYYNPEAADIVFQQPTPKTLVPLDATGKVILTFEHFQQISKAVSRGAQFLQKVLPWSFRAHHQHMGVEGVLLREVTALAIIANPGLARTQPMTVKVETQGELTRGMTVCDRRPFFRTQPNCHMVMEVDVPGVINYIYRVLNLD